MLTLRNITPIQVLSISDHLIFKWVVQNNTSCTIWIKWKIYEWCNFSTSITQRNFRTCMSEFKYTYWLPVFLSQKIAWVSKHDFRNWKHTVKKWKRNFSKHLKDNDEQLWIVVLTVLHAPCSRLDLHRCKGKFPNCSIARTWHTLTKTEHPDNNTAGISRRKKPMQVFRWQMLTAKFINQHLTNIHTAESLNFT